MKTLSGKNKNKFSMKIKRRIRDMTKVQTRLVIHLLKINMNSMTKNLIIDFLYILLLILIKSIIFF
jgi:hypothetical protein